MAQVARYQPQRLFAEHDVVKTFHGLDPLTGLPVLIYRFAGRPTAKVGELKSEAVPTILTSTVESGRGQLVVAYARGYEPLQEPLQPHEVAGLLRDSATALFDATRASVVHGDLRPGRFLKANDHVMVEGYGVPWAIWDAVSEFSAPERIGGATAKSDVFSWARSVQFLAGRHLPGDVAELISACLDADPKSRPNAETIYRQLAEPLEELAEDEATPFDNLDFAQTEETFARNPFAKLSNSQRGEAAAPDTPDVSSAAATLPRSTSTRSASTRASERDPDLTLGSDSDDPFGFGSVRERATPPGRARGRRALLLTALLIALLVLGALAFFNRSAVSAVVAPTLDVGVGAVMGFIAGLQRGDEGRGGSYLVNVEVIPANLQADLFVVESPAGSSLPLERPISVVPGSAVLDRTGIWRLQVQVGERRSEVREVRVPDERSVAFALPWVAPAVRE